jgi:hypothetical protein
MPSTVDSPLRKLKAKLFNNHYEAPEPVPLVLHHKKSRFTDDDDDTLSHITYNSGTVFGRFKHNADDFDTQSMHTIDGFFADESSEERRYAVQSFSSTNQQPSLQHDGMNHTLLDPGLQHDGMHHTMYDPTLQRVGMHHNIPDPTVPHVGMRHNIPDPTVQRVGMHHTTQEPSGSKKDTQPRATPSLFQHPKENTLTKEAVETPFVQEPSRLNTQERLKMPDVLVDHPSLQQQQQPQSSQPQNSQRNEGKKR